MKAIINTTYGTPDVLRLEEVERPTANASEVVINVHATTVTAGDVKTRKGEPFLVRFMSGLTRPKRKILGFEFAGEIESVGANVKRFAIGDPVFGVNMKGGSYAEYMSLPEDGVLAIKPSNMTYEEAAAGPSGAVVALQGLQKQNVQPGQRVLIYGASGSLGTFAVQLTKHLGAEVTGVTSTTNLEMVKSLGADKVVDYTKENFADNGETYDLLFDTVGKSSFSQSKGSLKPGGVYLSSWPTPTLLLQVIRTSLIGKKKARIMTENPSLESLTLLKELSEAGEVEPVIDRRYPLEQTAEAHRYVEKGHKKGKCSNNSLEQTTIETQNTTAHNGSVSCLVFAWRVGSA